MSETNDKDIPAIFAEHILIDQGIQKAINRAVWEHKQLGNPVAAWKDGKVVWIAPEDLDIELLP
ncbi:MAG: hypothetical protein J7545_10975 [Roseofilum sp. SBFL]|uniref:hypothetical protein n=1 Tax=unclassified Roseofilum TaxID=2620099 RepID=UPI001B0C03C4|nr:MULTISPECIES: hypothetical protein [unclassified Roseofilum]MBP0014947.1 hypothetical protein [Roseofilum sp. SID3]MBP0024657.1 hypothetical protein [Roseofilum sp. SID2]MBP0032803.1 hypothetical protein [Roseofilum sp. Belize BBD 4]MBP0039850.1 hypothetical protein [Roseofilum sp. SID1]MBP0042482.1 hypothetical protein [Roseofilum sp. SBFL]